VRPASIALVAEKGTTVADPPLRVCSQLHIWNASSLLAAHYGIGIVVTIFKTAATSAPTTVLGDVEVKRSGSAVESKTNPSFNGSVPKVALPATEPAKTSATHGPDVQRHFIPSVTTLSNSVAAR
jgi:hypothetical protein